MRNILYFCSTKHEQNNNTMEREIEFKGLRTDKKEWVYGGLIYIDGTMHIFEDGNLFKHKVKPLTVGQYTNINDNNGHKIYEGDIIEFFDTLANERRTGTVEYYNGRFIVLTEYRTQIDLACALDKVVKTKPFVKAYVRTNH